MRGRPGTRRGSKGAKKSTRNKATRAKTGRSAIRKVKAPAKKKAARKAAATPARKKSTAKKSGVKKTSAKRITKRTPRSSKKEVFGEGNYSASRDLRDRETDFVRRNRNKIESPGKEADMVLEGDEGEKTEELDEEARSRSHSPGDEH